MQRRTRKNKRYSAELKLSAVLDYLGGDGSMKEIFRKYGILSDKQLCNWILWYNGHREFKERSSSARREFYMIKVRNPHKRKDLK